jgi:hypothetical protein
MKKQHIPTLDEAREDRTIFAIVPGRFYQAMWCVSVPPLDGFGPFGKGGDVTSLLWREEDQPREWVYQWRFRYYKDAKVWGGSDKKIWYYSEFNGSVEEALRAALGVCTNLAIITNGQIGEMIIEGDNEKFFAAVRTQKPPWLNIGISDEVASQGGNPKGN